ncbi:MAG: type II toxin-antitoxin system Phd/YefM family antitoxin [Acidobacteria bacterium]|nr:type II toxin-antitoxin system Phd/YefM family antitoxin [Acidobacteriota bacterium]
MRVYTFSEARQRLAELLNQARREGKVQIRRRDGQIFTVSVEFLGGSPLDIPPVTTHVSTEELVGAVRESRELGERYVRAAPPHKRMQRAARSARRR